MIRRSTPPKLQDTLPFDSSNLEGLSQPQVRALDGRDRCKSAQILRGVNPLLPMEKHDFKVIFPFVT